MPSLEGSEHVVNMEVIHHGMTRKFAEKRSGGWVFFGLY
jgi:hypothetical protein